MLEAQEQPALDRAIDDLRIGARSWARLDLRERIETLGAVRPLIVRHAREWVGAAAAAKGGAQSTQVQGEEWILGPFAVLYAINRYIRTLHSLQTGGTITLPGPIRKRNGGGIAAPVFPVSAYDRLLFSGIRIEVWAQNEQRGAYYRQSTHEPKVALVLGAGNVAAIGPLDVLYKMIAEGAACILKMNPVNEYLAPIFEKIFAPLIEHKYLRIVTGGADTGAYLTAHRGVDEIHITGSAHTHDAIVFGTSDPNARNGRTLDKPLTSELGNVSPLIVLPGEWTAQDLRFQAENVVTQKMNNAGFNCIAAQVLILPAQWPQADAFLAEIEAVIARTAPRAGYYPGAGKRQQTFAKSAAIVREYDKAQDGIVPRTLVHVDANSDHPAFTTEAFCSVLAVTRLPGNDAASFLRNAVSFANDRLYGTLGASIIVDPQTERGLGQAFEAALEELRYGCIGINGWSALGFLLSEATWGAYPGHILEDIQSGIGVVHNTFLFDHAQKSIARAAFREFPRALKHGSFSVLPRPPWFVTNKRGPDIMRRLVAFEYAPSLARIPGIFLSALRG